MTLVAALLATFVAACSAQEPAGEDPPAAATIEATPPRLLLLVIVDTLRADHLGAYGYERFTSPVLDGLAAAGTLFEDASSTSPWTLPAHASMFTGLHPAAHRATTYRTALPKHLPTLASLLGGAGLRTAAIVSSPWLKREDFGLTRDFDQYRYVEIPAQRMSPSTLVTDQAITWMQEWGDARGFLVVHYYDVHSDYTSEPEYERLFVAPYDGPADGTGTQLLQANFEDDYVELCHRSFDEQKCAFGAGDNRIVLDETVDRIRFDERDVQHLRDLYDAGIRQMDTELGRLFAFLDESGRADDTLLLVTSDHGEEFMDHGRVDHFLSTHQESLRVPLIVRGPGVPAGVRVPTPVSLIDVAPTLLRAAGVEPPALMEGRDLAPLWRGEPDPGFDTRFLYGEAAGGLSTRDLVPDIFPIYTSVRKGRYKLVHESKNQTARLYDLSVDPLEQRDIAARKPDVVAMLRSELDARIAALDRAPDDENRVELDPEQLDELRELGYVP